MLSIDELNELVQERVKALIEFDLEYAERIMPNLDRETLILGMHKSRYICELVPKELRHKSAEFLRAGGHLVFGAPVLPIGELP